MLSRHALLIVLALGCYRAHEVVSTEDRDAGRPEVAARGPWFAYAASIGSSPPELGVFVTRVGDEPDRVVSDATWDGAAWSPTTSSLAAAWIDAERGTHLEVIAYDDDGLADRRELFASSERFFVLEIHWAPRGEHVAAVMESGDTRERRVLVFEPGGSLVVEWEGSSGLWSPDGTMLASLRGSGDDAVLLLVSIDEGGVETVSLPSGARAPEGPTWSPDSSRLLVRTKAGEMGDRRFVLVDREGTSELVTPEGFFSVSHPRWSTDGSWLLYTGTSLTPTADARLYVQPVGAFVREPIEVARLADPGGHTVHTDAHWTARNRLLVVQSAGGATRATHRTFREDEVVTEEAFGLEERCETVRRPRLPTLLLLDCRGPERAHRLFQWSPSLGPPSPRLLGILDGHPNLEDVDSWTPGRDRLLFSLSEGSGEWSILESDAELGLTRRQSGAKRWTNVRPNSLRPWSSEASAYWFRRSDDEVVIEHLSAGITWPVARPGESRIVRVYGFAPE